MTHVVTPLCIGCKDMSCADACPCDCFHEGPEMLYINPEACIDCEACVYECPVDAIFSEDNLPASFVHAVELNRAESEKQPVVEKN